MTDGAGELDPKLIENLSSSKAEEREAARHAIERLGPRVVDEMLVRPAGDDAEAADPKDADADVALSIGSGSSR